MYDNFNLILNKYRKDNMSDLLPASKQMINYLIGKGPKYELKGPTMTSISNPLTQASYGTSLLRTQSIPTCADASQVSSLTSLDLANSLLYARNRILYDKCVKLAQSGTGVAWQQTIPDGSVPYLCPSSLMTGSTGSQSSTCFYGHCAFTTESECMKHSKLPYDPKTGEYISSTGANSFYMEWRQRPEGPAGSMGCYLGNSPFRRWCEIPETRNPSTSDPPFTYIANGPTGGTCHMTEDYCNAKNSDWDPDSQSCYKSGGQQFVEALFGNTIDAWFRGNCGTNPFLSESASLSHPRYSKNDKLAKLSDRKIKDRLVKIGPDYGGPGVHLYLYGYKPEAHKIISDPKALQLGFIADEVEKIYPELIEIRDGYKWIVFNSEHINDKKYWRLINTIRNEHIILRLLLTKTVLRPGSKSNMKNS